MDGILPLWKPAGMTSHDCVVKLRRILKTKKIGHTGTLDPGVEGVLPMCIGRATKIAQFVTEMGKSYRAEVTIGIATTTEDADGEIVSQKKVDKTFTRDEIERVLASLTGEIEQIPPMYSSVKVKGRPLYEYARKGIEVERPRRKVNIYRLKLLDDQEYFSGDPLRFSIEVDCGKGTYIRTLAVMIGERLGYPAHMSKLVRTVSAGIDQEKCLTFPEIEEKVAEGTIAGALLPIEEVLKHLPRFEMNDALARQVKNGRVLKIPAFLENVSEQPIAMYHAGKIIAIYKKHPDKPGLMKPARVLQVNE